MKLKRPRYLDYTILIPFLVLCAIGIVMVYSASAYWIKVQYGMAETAMLKRQAIFVVIGCLEVAFIYHINLGVFRSKWTQGPIVAVTLGLLLFLLGYAKLHPEAAVNGATSWLHIGPIPIQPSEFAKLVLILYLAQMLSKFRNLMAVNQNRPGDLIKPTIIALLFAGAILLQPDTGGAIVIVGIAVVMILASGIAFRWGFIAIGSGTVAAAAAWWFFTHIHFSANFLKYHYRIRRIVTGFRPFADADKGGLQVVNSLLAIDHGGLFGVGLGMSSQKLGYLPEPHTDFILAVIAEELGILFAILVVGLILFLILRFYQIGIRSTNSYRALIAYGIATMMLIQTVFNVGAVVNFIPVTGVTLPFISYGGSSMMVLCAGIGIMLNISRNEQIHKEKLNQRNRQVKGGEHA